MKKLTSLLAMMLMAVATLSFVSCDDDEEIADTLWGVWEGNMYIAQGYDGYYYTSTSSVLAFDRDPGTYSSGSGYWIDYYSGGRYNYFASNISWTVRNGVIQIYSYEEGIYYYIYDYDLSYGEFHGWLYSDVSSTPVEFHLYKTSAPNWSAYDWNGWGYYGSGYGYYDYGYYAPKKGKAATDSTTAEPKRLIIAPEAK